MALLDRFQGDVDGASMALFRASFGLLMAWETVRFMGSGWVGRYYIEPSFFFHYLGFGWVHPLPGTAMYAAFVVLGILGLALATGRWARPVATLFTLGWAYIFLLDQANYLIKQCLVCDQFPAKPRALASCSSRRRTSSTETSSVPRR